MKLLILALLALPIFAQFDQYGGARALPCPTGPKPLFYTEKIGDRWWWCTPEGNTFFLHSVWNVNSSLNSDRAGQKFGGTLSSTQSRMAVVARRVTKWGFNAFDAYSSRYASPTANAHIQLGYKTALPVIMGEGLRPSFYGLGNTNNLVSQPLKSYDTPMVWNNAARTPAWRMQDPFDANYRAYFLGMLSNTTDNAYAHVFSASAAKRSYVMGWSIDDTDWVSGFGAGPNFNTFEDGGSTPSRRHQNLAVIALYTAPTQGVLARSPATGSGKLYADPRAATVTCFGAEEAGSKGLPGYSTGVMTQTIYPSDTVCVKQALRKFLQDRYSTIAALNEAWGSAYTTFGSTGTVVSNQLLAVADGTDTITATIPGISASNKIAAFSMRVYVNNVYVAADVRHLSSSLTCYNGPSIPLDRGHIWGEGMRGSVSASCTNLTTNPVSTINYQTGVVVLKFDTAPPAGQEIRLDYVTNGWGTGTGLMDEYGKSPWLVNIETSGTTQQDSQLLSTVDADIKSDLDEFLYRYAYRYFKDMRDTLDSKYAPLTGCDRNVNGGKGTCPVYTGPSYLGTWGTPTFAQVIRAASEFVDVYPYYSWPDFGSDYAARLNFLYTHWGDKPIMAWEGHSGGLDSPYPVDGGDQVRPKSNTQAARGSQYKAAVSAMQSFRFPNGSYPGIGTRWWDYQGDSGEITNWGFITPNDDPLDGSCPGPGTRSELIPGGSVLSSVVVTSPSASVQAVATTTTFHSMSIGTLVRFGGCTVDADLCSKEWPVVAIASGNFTVSLDSSVGNATYNEPGLKIEYVRYPCGGSNHVCMVCSAISSNRYLSDGSDPRRTSDPDGPFNNSFGDFLTYVREANGYWLSLMPRQRVAFE